MKQCFLTVVLLLQILNVACNQDKKPNVSQPINENDSSASTQNKKPNIPEGWKKVQECGLSFHIPSDLKETKVLPFDSCAKKYRSKNIIFSIDLVENGGIESSSRGGEYSDTKDFQIEKKIVDGQNAELITYYLHDNGGFKERQDLFYGAVLYVPMIEKTNDNLTIWTYSRTANDRETTMKIFATVSFDK